MSGKPEACRRNSGPWTKTGGKEIEGYFAVFGSRYELFPGASESIDPHAFDGELTGDVRAPGEP